jgi:hypothetical protein
VGEQLPVGLYDSEKECGADAEQQHAVHRFEALSIWNRGGNVNPGISNVVMVARA